MVRYRRHVEWKPVTRSTRRSSDADGLCRSRVLFVMLVTMQSEDGKG